MVVICLFLIPWISVWMRNSRKTNRTNTYSIVIYDVNGQIINLYDLRINFKNNDVAWSFMKEYKEIFPSYNFGLISIGKKTEQPIMIKYL
mgnify:CR=1 FL=1